MSKCKYLLEIRMIIERHMPHLCGLLPFIDHVAQMLLDHITKIEVETKVEPIGETNPAPSEMEVWNSKIQMTEEATQCLK